MGFITSKLTRAGACVGCTRVCILVELYNSVQPRYYIHILSSEVSELFDSQAGVRCRLKLQSVTCLHGAYIACYSRVSRTPRLNIYRFRVVLINDGPCPSWSYDAQYHEDRERMLTKKGKLKTPNVRVVTSGNPIAYTRY